MSDWLVPVPILAAVAGAAVGGLVSQLLSRRTAKKEPKTEARAKVYQALIEHLVGGIRGTLVARDAVADRALVGLLARLALFGESKVVEAMARFTTAYLSQPDGVPARTLMPVIQSMRESLLTGTRSDTLAAIQATLDALCTLPTPAPAGENQPTTLPA